MCSAAALEREKQAIWDSEAVISAVAWRKLQEQEDRLLAFLARSVYPSAKEASNQHITGGRSEEWERPQV